MNKKILLVMIPILLSLGLFSSAKAMTVAEIQAQISALQAQIAQLQAQLAQMPTEPTGPVAWCHDFNTDFWYGNSGSEVEALQIALEKEGFTIDISEKSRKFFGSTTLSALVGFQEKYASEILSPLGLLTGTGYVGVNTRAKLNILYGCPKPPLIILSPNGGETLVSIDHVTDTASGNEKFLKHITWTGGSNPNSTNSVDAYLEQLINGQYVKTGRILPAGYGSIAWIVGVVSNPNCTYPDGVGNLPIPSDYCWLKTNMKVVPTGQYYVHFIDRITKSEDRSDASFSIVSSSSSSLTLLSPNGGETLYEGQQFEIRWTASNIPSTNTFTIGITSEDRANGEIIRNLPSTQRSYLWTVEIPPLGFGVKGSSLASLTILAQTITPEPTRYKIWVSTGTGIYPEYISDGSDNYFSVLPPTQPYITLLSPNGGETWKIGETRDITWRSSGVEKVYIGIRCTQGAILTSFTSPNIAREVPASLGKFSWKVDVDSDHAVPTDLSPSMCDAYKITIGSEVQIGKAEVISGISDESYSDFWIKPSITLLSPNGGETWISGNTYDIKWINRGLKYVTIVLWASNNPAVEATSGYDAFGITMRTDATQESYKWTINPTASYINPSKYQYYKISITGTSSTNVNDFDEDESDNYFSIISSTTAACCSGTTRYYNCSGSCSPTNCSTSENCATKSSIDSDGGNVIDVAGTVTDYDGCSSGSCTSTTYPDHCAGTNNNDLHETYNSGASYTETTYTLGTSAYCANNRRYTCSAGTANCNQNPSDACEVTLATDPNNCGSCGNTCGIGKVCVSSNCVTAPVCTRKDPTIIITPNPQNGNAGAALNYTFGVKNTDTAACPASTFSLWINACPQGWICSLNQQFINLNPGDTNNTTSLTISSPISTLPGEYIIEVAALNPSSGYQSLGYAIYTVGTSSSYTLIAHKAGSGSGTITSNPAGINCGTVCSSNFAVGTSVTLTAVPAAGSYFTGWSEWGGCSGTGTCTLTMNANTTVTATFNTPSASYLLIVSKVGTGSGTVVGSPAGINCGATCSYTFSSGALVTLTASASSGSTFAGWSGGGCSGTGTCTVTMTAAKTVTATFNAVAGGRTTWAESCGTATKSGCACSNTTEWFCAGTPKCSYTCPARTNTTASSNCNYIITNPSGTGSGMCDNANSTGECSAPADCRAGFACFPNGSNPGACTYTCVSGWKDANNNSADGCETAITASSVEPLKGMESMLASIANAISQLLKILK
jgi:hypothetical protein